jgi:hypothetical protein
MKIYLGRVNNVSYKYAKCYYEFSYILGYKKKNQKNYSQGRGVS